MRILFVTRKYPPSVGGMELFAYELSRALAAQADVRLVAWGGSGRLRTVLVALPSLTVRAFASLCRGGIDIIHTQDSLLAPSGYVLSRLFRKRFTVVVHGLDMTYHNWLFRAVVPWAVRRADTVFCISQAAATAAREHGVDAAKIEVIPLAVSDTIHGTATSAELFEQLRLPTNSKVLVTVGRLVKRKGVSWFIENVLPGLAEHYPELVYLVVGEGQERPAIEAAVQQAGLGRRVRLLGKATDSLYQAVYNGADVFVMPNIAVPGDIEGFGLVLLEASLCGLPIVAAGLEGIKDAVADGQSARLVPPGDALAFRREIGRFLDKPEDAKQFGKRSRRFTLEHYQWPALAKRYLERYRQLVG